MKTLPWLAGVKNRAQRRPILSKCQAKVECLNRSEKCANASISKIERTFSSNGIEVDKEKKDETNKGNDVELLRGVLPIDWWKYPSSQRLFMDRLVVKLGYPKPDDWYRVSAKDIFHHGGAELLSLYDNSLLLLFRSVYPDIEFLPWLFTVPYGYWDIRNNRIKYIDWLKEKVGKSESFLKVWHFKENGGADLLAKYADSPTLVLESLSVATLDASNVSSTDSMEIWSTVEKQKMFLDSIGLKMGVKGDDLSSWYHQKHQTLIAYGLGPLLHHYNGSLSLMLSTIYSKYDWISWKFNYMPKGSRLKPEVIMPALKLVEGKLNMKSLDDWYRVPMSRLAEYEVRFLVPRKGSLYQTLKQAYPNHDWIPWKFSPMPKGDRQNEAIIDSALNHVEEKLSLKSPEDWYRVSYPQLRKVGVRFLTRTTPLFKILKKYRPSFQWDESKFAHISYRSENR